MDPVWSSSDPPDGFMFCWVLNFCYIEPVDIVVLFGPQTNHCHRRQLLWRLRLNTSSTQLNRGSETEKAGCNKNYIKKQLTYPQRIRCSGRQNQVKGHGAYGQESN